ncbi:MAG: glycosyltransferase family 2 protein [Pricia sp.]
MKLSIIIPAFNVEPYISDCLTSILNQKFEKDALEIIFVDDKSTDKTLEIAKFVLRDVDNVQFIANDSNFGNGESRKVGLNHAQGEYVYFIDADDYIAKDCLQNLYGLAKAHELDMLFFSMKRVTDSSKLLSNTEWDPNTSLKIADGITYIGENVYRDEVWSYFIKRDFLLDSGVWYYHKRKFGQDIFITSKLLTMAKRVSSIDYEVYRYRFNPNSILAKKNEDHLIFHIESVETALTKCVALKQSLDQNSSKGKKAFLRLHVKQQRLVTIIIMRFVQTNRPFSYIKKKLKKYRSLGVYPMKSIFELKDFDSRSQRRMTFIFNRPFLLRHFTGLYRLYKKVR